MGSVVKQLTYALKLFRVTAGSIHSSWIHGKETLGTLYSKYLVLDMIQRIHRRYGSRKNELILSCFGSMTRFWILVKTQNIRFRIKNPDLDFSKETHPREKKTTTKPSLSSH